MPLTRIEKYIGRRVEIVYEDSRGNFTRRRVSIYSIRDGKVRVLDWGKRCYGTLSVRRIKEALPFIGRAV